MPTSGWSDESGPPESGVSGPVNSSAAFRVPRWLRLVGYGLGYLVSVLGVSIPGIWLQAAYEDANVVAVVAILVLVGVNLRFFRDVDASRRIYCASLRGRELCECGRFEKPAPPPR